MVDSKLKIFTGSGLGPVYRTEMPAPVVLLSSGGASNMVKRVQIFFSVMLRACKVKLTIIIANI